MHPDLGMRALNNTTAQKPKYEGKQTQIRRFHCIRAKAFKKCLSKRSERSFNEITGRAGRFSFCLDTQGILEESMINCSLLLSRCSGPKITPSC